MRGDDLSRFVVEDRGYETPCYIWVGPHNQKGYGLVKAGRSSRAAHRVVYENAYGAVLPGYSVDHLCRMRDCIREDHLQAVIHRVNVRRGANQKLTRHRVREVRAAAASGRESVSSLARRFELSRPTITEIVSGRHWLAR